MENLRDDIAAMGDTAFPGDGLVVVEQGMLDATWAELDRLTTENGRLERLLESRLPVQPVLGQAQPMAAGFPCCDCRIRPAVVQVVPCGHICWCVICYANRMSCSFC
jgi:hypothetical protein